MIGGFEKIAEILQANVNEFMIVRRGIGAVQTVGEGRNLLVPFKNDGTVANANVTNNISLIFTFTTIELIA